MERLIFIFASILSNNFCYHDLSNCLFILNIIFYICLIQLKIYSDNADV